MTYHSEPFTTEERAILARFFTNADEPVFALINLPEVVKGALFARYSRSAKSIRRLFLDEFAADPETGIQTIAESLAGEDPLVDLQHAERLYERVFFEYGDDSVAQLGGAHLACEQASNVLTKVLERGRIASYLEQSTRYIYYDTKLGDRYRYFIPPEIDRSPLSTRYRSAMDELFTTYSALVAAMKDIYEVRFPRTADDSSAVYNATIRAKACDAVRGLLPAATQSNLGIYATGQAYESLLMRMQSHPLEEARTYGSMMLGELRKVIPSFLSRVDRPDRGLRWSAYLADTRRALESQASHLPGGLDSEPSVMLTRWDPDGESAVVAAALYAASELSDGQIRSIVGRMSDEQRASVIADLVGDRENRRHKPGRAMEATGYRFDVTCDFGAFRDLQRHRMLTIEWQRLTTHLGFDRPADVFEAGLGARWDSAMETMAELYEETRKELGADVAQYVVPFAYNIRFVMDMNAREAFHLLELRSQPAGHSAYRRVAQDMHRQIAEVAGHRHIAAAMRFVDYSSVDLERLESERRAEQRRSL